MEEFINAILGEHGLGIYVAAFFWTIPGIAIVKAYYYDRKLNTVFSWAYWWNDNLRSVLIGFLATMIFVRLGDAAIHLVKQWGFELGFDVEDFTGVALIFSMWSQNRLHKTRKPLNKKVQTQMEVANALHRHENRD